MDILNMQRIKILYTGKRQKKKKNKYIFYVKIVCELVVCSHVDLYLCRRSSGRCQIYRGAILSIWVRRHLSLSDDMAVENYLIEWIEMDGESS